MNLKDKLDRLSRSHPVAVPPSRQFARGSDRAPFLPGSTVTGPEGNLWHCRTEYPLSRRHGRFALAELLKHAAPYLDIIARERSPRFERLLFFDTETTGLSGGVGTLAFIIGAGYVEGDRFIVEQFFLQQFSQERALLHAFGGLLRTALTHGGALVSFNGKAYDLPLVQNRMILHRLGALPDRIPHIDVIHPARRLWKQYLPDCSLATLEAALLEVKRPADIPSPEIPETFFSYLRTGDPRPLLPVFQHNRMDILSTAVLLGLIAWMFADDGRPGHIPADCLAMGQMIEKTKDFDRARRFYRQALQRPLPEGIKKHILVRLARLHKRARDYHTASSLWKAALECSGFCPVPYEELAKVWEHNLCDLGEARRYAMRALDMIGAVEQLDPGRSFREARQRLVWRLDRLERKLARHKG